MIYVAIGSVGFLVIQLFDVVSLKRIPWVKPVVWIVGSELIAYAVMMASIQPDKLTLPDWSTWLGWVLLPGAAFMLIFSLFVNLPFLKTYVSTGVGDKLIKTGLYALVRHPVIHGFVFLMLSLILVSQSRLLLIAAPIWILLDILVIVIEDKFLFGRMFDGYARYQQETPMLVPNKRSINAFINSLRHGKA